MKLAALVLASLVSLAGVAAADPVPPRPAVRQLLLERFDRNHDGRLDRREKRHAIRALRRLTRMLARGERRGMRAQRLIRRYDMNGDGNVGPGEMPPAAAERLRRFDRNGDGWLDPQELGE